MYRMCLLISSDPIFGMQNYGNMMYFDQYKNELNLDISVD